MTTAIRMLGKCEGCGTTMSVVAVSAGVVGGYERYVADGVDLGAHRLDAPLRLRMTKMCPCGNAAPGLPRWRVKLSNVVGVVTKTKCGPKCWDAEGDSLFCKCRCGGLNHGAGYDFAGINPKHPEEQ